ncbi:MAG: CDP-glucose 4,6-dehydratase [Bacteroidales bacterium]
MTINDLFGGFYRGKRVLITGHTGFKGAWLSVWLNLLGADVVGVALDPDTDKGVYSLSGIGSRIIDLRGDIRDAALMKSIFTEYNPDIVFHLAAQPLVRLSYEIPAETYNVNVMGTVNILEAVRELKGKCAAVMITTDKCYENKEIKRGYREDDAMGGYDPYSSSKGAAEIAIASWRRSFFNLGDYAKHKKSVASARAGNVIGGGDWALDRIIPDCVRALESGTPITIRNRNSVRPWQHVLEPLGGYMLLAMNLWNEPLKFSDGWNFGPKQESVVSVWEIASKVINCYGCGSLIDKSDLDAPHEAALLMLDITKAKNLLGWSPRMDVDKTVAMTVDWYKRYVSEDCYNLCLRQINKYISE